jgi:hypothetical protein
MLEPLEKMLEKTEDIVSSFERCKISFEGFLLQTQNSLNPLHVDVQMRPLASPWGTETPPLSPGTYSPFICFLMNEF